VTIQTVYMARIDY